MAKQSIEMMSNEEIVQGLLSAQMAVTDGAYAMEHGIPSTFADYRRLDAFRKETLIRLGELSEDERLEHQAPESIPDEILAQMFGPADLTAVVDKVRKEDWIDKIPVLQGVLSVDYGDGGECFLGPEAGEYFGTNVGRIKDFIPRIFAACGSEMPNTEESPSTAREEGDLFQPPFSPCDDIPM